MIFIVAGALITIFCVQTYLNYANQDVLENERFNLNVIFSDSNFRKRDTTNHSMIYTDLNAPNVHKCTDDEQCNHGECKIQTLSNSSYCKCDEGVITVEEPCDYILRPKLIAFLLSFFLGGLGVDWFFLSRGNGCYICLGILKIVSLGGCSIWYFVDWIRILCDAFNDGNGQALASW